MRDRAQGSLQPLGEITSPNNPPKHPPPPPDGHVIDNMGKLTVTDDHAVYTGSSHWVTLLEDIQCLKDELSVEDPNSNAPRPEYTLLNNNLIPEELPTHRMSLLRSAPYLAKEQILAMIPQRKIVDRHISYFFNTFDIGPFILPRTKFLTEYAKFWRNPSAAPVMWVGLLFSIMSISALLQQQDVGALESQHMLETYRSLTIHCLIAGDYLRPGSYTIETLILYYTVEQHVNSDHSIESWIFIAVIIRIALRMGLHRDPSHWPNIRPLQAEVRRRVWISLYQMDFFTSTQLGLPRIIKDSQCDTQPPTHLLDHDLVLEHNELPRERPLTESTPLLFIIQRNIIIKVAAEIYDSTEAGPPSPITSVALSAKLERAIDAIPASFKFQSLEMSITDNPVTILQQIYLDILIHKAIYLLHRRSFIKDSAGEESTKSNQLCIKAAISILEHQRRISEETQPGGLMFAIRWKVAASLTHEFLQATMMLCFALSKFNDENTGITYQHNRDDVLRALAFSKSLWEQNANGSAEAQGAVKAITTVLQQTVNESIESILTSPNERFSQIPAVGAESCFGSFDFDYEQAMALDPSLFSVDNDIIAFGGVMDDFSS